MPEFNRAKYSKPLSFLLVLAMVLTSFSVFNLSAERVYADSATVTKEVYLSFQQGGFIVPKKLATVSSDLAEIYGYTDNVSSSTAVSALDVLVKTHEIRMGIVGAPNQDDINNINSMLTVNNSGFISKVMSETTGNFGFTINGANPHDGTISPWGGYNGYSLNQAVVNQNDNLEFFIYSDSSGLDNYSWFNLGSSKVKSLTVLPDSDISLTLEGYSIGWYGLSTNPAISKIGDAQIVTVNKTTGETSNLTGKITDTNNGDITLSFSTPGAYVISAVANPDDLPIIMPWLDVTVIDPASNIPADVPADDVRTYITITDSSSTYVTKQAIDVGWFDIRPFISSGAENYVLSNKILTANALIEGVYCKLFGKDPSKAELQLASNSTTAQAIRSSLNIYVGKWGLSTGSVFANDKLLMSAINDSFGYFGIGGDEVSSGSSIVFYSLDKDYSYFDVMQVNTGFEDYGTKYPTIDLKLKMTKKTYPSTTSPIEGAGIYVVGSDYCYGTTSNNGVANLHFMRGTDPSGEFIVTALADGVIKPYLKISYTWDGNNVSITNISQIVKSDTSLSSFKINAYGSDLDVSNYANNNLPYSIDNNVDKVTLTAIAADNNTVVSAVTHSGVTTKTYSFPMSTGGSLSLGLDPGINLLTFELKNGSDTENYTLKVNRSNASLDVLTDVNQVINGIADYSGYSPSDYDYNLINGKLGAGKAITASEKENFLKLVLNDVSSANVGQKAKMAIALTNLNIDATKVPTKNSNTINDLVASVYNHSENTLYITYVPYMLMLEDLGNYTVPSNAKWGRPQLIQYVLDNYSGDSGWNIGNGIDGAAMMIPALAPYYKASSNPLGHNGISQASCAAIKVKVDEVVSQLKNLQADNGSFNNNADTTAVVIAALASLGIDANGSEFTKAASGKSALESIFEFKTADNRLGHTSPTYNKYASIDGLQALAAYVEYYNAGTKTGDGCIYRFTKEVTPYTSWPDAKLITSIKVIPPTNTVYTYSSTEKNYSADTTGMVISAIYNGNQNDTSNILPADCTISTINRSVSGTQTVNVTYQGYTTSFTVTVKNIDDTVPLQSLISVSIRSNNGLIASMNSMVIEENKTTALNVLKNLLDSKGINYIIKNGIYVSEINGLGEFSKGANSGWLYSVNGTTPTSTPASDYRLKNGDSVLWYYTLDFTKDSSSSSWTQPAKETASTVIAATVDSSGKATATMTKAELTNLLKEEKSALKIESSVATLTFDKTAMENILKETAGDIKISVAKVDQKLLSEETKQIVGDRPVYDFSVTGGNKSISSFGGKVKVSLPYTASADENPEKIVIYHIDDNGNLKMIKDCKYDSKTKSIVFTTEHFSKYAVGYKSVNFDDVNGHWSLSNINYLASRGIINGKTGNSFKPNDNITRAEFVTILANNGGGVSSSKNAESASSSKNTSPTALTPEFADVSANSWFSDSVSWAFANDLVKGSDSKFRPNDKITRQEIAVILDRYLANVEKSKASSTAKTTGFADESSIDAYAKSSVIKMKELGIINGKTAYNFVPKDYATRGETAKMITYMIQSSL